MCVFYKVRKYVYQKWKMSKYQILFFFETSNSTRHKTKCRAGKCLKSRWPQFFSELLTPIILGDTALGSIRTPIMLFISQFWEMNNWPDEMPVHQEFEGSEWQIIRNIEIALYAPQTNYWTGSARFNVQKLMKWPFELILNPNRVFSTSFFVFLWCLVQISDIGKFEF